MLPKITMVYDRKKNRKIEACVYYMGKRRYMSTGVTLPDGASYRDGVVGGCRTAPSLNKTLNTCMNVLQGQLQEQIEKDSFDLGAFSLALTFTTDSFFDWALRKNATLNVRKSSQDEYKRALERFNERGVSLFSDVTQAKVQRAVDAMTKDGMYPTTVRNYYTIFGQFVRTAVRERLVTGSPLDGISLPKGGNKEINYLTREELAAVEAYECCSKYEQTAKDMFLFACYTGLAYADLTKIKREDIELVDGKPCIADRRKKTGGSYRLRMMPKAMEILERRDFDFNMLNSQVNATLERIEKKIEGFKKHLTMHVGRHTFATLALSAGVRIETVSRMLAHADIKTTQIYAKVLQKDVDEGFDILEKI